MEPAGTEGKQAKEGRREGGSKGEETPVCPPHIKRGQTRPRPLAVKKGSKGVFLGGARCADRMPASSSCSAGGVEGAPPPPGWVVPGSCAAGDQIRPDAARLPAPRSLLEEGCLPGDSGFKSSASAASCAGTKRARTRERHTHFFKGNARQGTAHTHYSCQPDSHPETTVVRIPDTVILSLSLSSSLSPFFSLSLPLSHFSVVSGFFIILDQAVYCWGRQ